MAMTMIRVGAALFGLALTGGMAAYAADLPSRKAEPPAPIFADIFGAIALSNDNEIEAFDWGAPTPREAAERALRFCRDAGGSGCKIVVAMENRSSFWRARYGEALSDPRQIHSCGVVAVGKDGRRATARSRERWDEAERLALDQCGGSANQCTIKRRVCT
ncbi:DUF4189 domain-containing protein [Bosea sp. (in: a-proteobacteria)]|jgi:hypothetical protein|uniref:DUF4189 domain-containing protein n=1 Tax=Bosea sp. (in: a-proteobacteria) TaxID=1871050 RepID=UPI002DDCF642|nr:DUF4189 domain-containing protein [Bosea sp. (in: a-proteobacteria)]HEV2512624.1 DUF4189 domain-containing protein [Bosea sp. (in: a-proteobacteria)]